MMNNKTESIHIIFNEFSKKTLTDNKELEIKANNIVSLDDDLRTGPLLDFNDSINKIEDRKEWLSKVLEKTIWAEKIVSNVEKDIEKLDEILSNEKSKTFYLWTGKNTRDIIGTARLISKLMKFNITIFITDFNKITIKNLKGNSFSPTSLVEIDSSQVHTIFKHFKKLEREQLIEWEELWRKVKTKNSLLRILANNREIKFKKETHFDNLLESFCNNEFQKTARVIAKTLLEIDFSVSDWFLNWRMKKLSEMKKLETNGELRDMRDYEVKITTYNTV